VLRYSVQQCSVPLSLKIYAATWNVCGHKAHELDNIQDFLTQDTAGEGQVDSDIYVICLQEAEAKRGKNLFKNISKTSSSSNLLVPWRRRIDTVLNPMVWLYIYI